MKESPKYVTITVKGKKPSKNMSFEPTDTDALIKFLKEHPKKAQELREWIKSLKPMKLEVIEAVADGKTRTVHLE